MQIKNLDREFIEKLNEENRIDKVCDIFNNYSKYYKECSLIYFNLGINPNLDCLKNNKINGYSIIGASDYNKAYILNNKIDVKGKNYFEIGKIINLDLNVLTYLKNVVNNKNLTDKKEFIEYLKFIKDNGYCLNKAISLLERISKPVNLNVWTDYILAYVKYDFLNEITEDTLKDKYVLPEETYMWAKELLDLSIYKEEKFDQFYVVGCLISKAFILKTEKGDLQTNILKLLEYSLNELNIYLEFELYLMYKYLSNDNSVQKAFAKIQSISKKTLDNIKNTTWDILHI